MSNNINFEAETKVDKIVSPACNDVKAIIFYMDVYNIHVCIALGVK